MADKKGKWVTIRGRHVFIPEGKKLEDVWDYGQEDGYEEDLGESVYENKHGTVHLNEDNEYEIRDNRGNKVGNTFSTDREAIEFLENDYEDDDYDDDLNIDAEEAQEQRLKEAREKVEKEYPRRGDEKIEKEIDSLLDNEDVEEIESIDSDFETLDTIITLANPDEGSKNIRNILKQNGYSVKKHPEYSDQLIVKKLNEESSTNELNDEDYGKFTKRIKNAISRGEDSRLIGGFKYGMKVSNKKEADEIEKILKEKGYKTLYENNPYSSYNFFFEK